MGPARQGKDGKHAHHLPVLHDIGTVGNMAHGMVGLRIRMAVRLLLHDGYHAGVDTYHLRHHAVPEIPDQALPHHLQQVRKRRHLQRDDVLVHLRDGLRKNLRLVRQREHPSGHRHLCGLHPALHLHGGQPALTLLSARRLQAPQHPVRHRPLHDADDPQLQRHVRERVHGSGYED